MRSLLLIASTSVALCMGATAAQAQRSPSGCISDPEVIAALEAKDGLQNGADTLGRSAFVCGRDWSAANLLEQANARSPTVINQFNLAAAYVATGRLEAGLELYRQAAARGRFTDIILDAAYDTPSQRGIWVNVSDEANLRITWLSQMISTRSPGAEPFTAGQAGVDAAERTGLTVTAAQTGVRLTDEQALARDGLR